MAQSDLGIKRICQACGARYYDLNTRPITCPSCGAPFDPEAILKSRRARVVNDDKPSATTPDTESEGEAADEVDLEEEDKDEIDGDDDALLEDDDPQADIEGEGVVTVIDEGDTNN